MFFGKSKTLKMKYLKEYIDLTKENEKNIILSEYLTEKVHRIINSYDQKSVIIGTNHGTVIVLSVEDFKI